MYPAPQAWCKVQLGFIRATDITNLPNTYSISQAATRHAFTLGHALGLGLRVAAFFWCAARDQNCGAGGTGGRGAFLCYTRTFF
jgi:hypothetical protein